LLYPAELRALYYTWDHRDRLTQVSEWVDDHEVTEVNYFYDAFNQFVHQTVDKEFDESFTSTAFIYEGGQVVLQFDAVSETSLVGDLEATDLSHRYLWNAAAVDQLLVDEKVWDLYSVEENENLWALTDNLGSARDMVDDAGRLRIHRAFDSFGNVVDETHYNTDQEVVSGPVGQFGYLEEAFAFTGRWLDQDTGLQNNLNRWYDSSTGRWMSKDPIGFAAGDANLYRYVGNDAMGWTDPFGVRTMGGRDRRLHRRRNWNGGWYCNRWRGGSASHRRSRRACRCGILRGRGRCRRLGFGGGVGRRIDGWRRYLANCVASSYERTSRRYTFKARPNSVL